LTINEFRQQRNSSRGSVASLVATRGGEIEVNMAWPP
jgi:hypothetical protein